MDLPNGQFRGDLGEAGFDFSPDGRFLTAKACGGTGTVVVVCDLHDRSLVKLARHLRSMMEHSGSVFVTGSTLLIGDGPNRAKQHIKIEKLVAFASGKKYFRGRGFPQTSYSRRGPRLRDRAVFSRDVIRKHDPNAPTFAVELSTGQVIVSHTPALDVFGQHYIAESGKLDHMSWARAFVPRPRSTESDQAQRRRLPARVVHGRVSVPHFETRISILYSGWWEERFTS